MTYYTCGLCKIQLKDEKSYLTHLKNKACVLSAARANSKFSGEIKSGT